MSENDYRNISFEIPMSNAQAEQFAEAFTYLTGSIIEQPFLFFRKQRTFEEVCPDAAEDLSAQTFDLAQALYQRACNTDFDADPLPDDLAKLSVEAIAGGVQVNNDSEWAPIGMAIATIQTAQDQFGGKAMTFEWGDFSRDAETNHYGGGAVLVAPGEEPKVFDSYQGSVDLLRAHQEGPPNSLATYEGLENFCLETMADLQKRHQYDLTDEDQRSHLVDTALTEAILETPLGDKLVLTAFHQGQRDADPDPAPEPGM